jgi:hypothetical protein
VDRRTVLAAAVAVVALTGTAGCTTSRDPAETPGLAARGTVLTTVKPAKRDVVNRVGLTGKVTIDPIFGIVAPASGEVRYVNRPPSAVPATEPVWVASVWTHGAPYRITIPPGSVLAGRLLDDRAQVTAGMPIVSAKHAGYGIVADIDSDVAYRLAGAARSVQGQIKNGPGPFPCTPLGTIAALPAGTIPAPVPSAAPSAAPAQDAPADAAPAGSEPTGLRLVCTTGRGVTLINGAAVTLTVVTASAAGVLALPVEAVAGTQGRGKVDVLDADRRRRTVDVELGLTDGTYVQIKSGLKGDETVAVPGPDLPEGAPAPGTNPSGGPG